MIIAAIRFVVFATVYATAVLWWAISARSHAAMGIVGIGIMLSGAAVPAWCGALLLTRMAASRSLRFVLHVTLVVALFAGLASLAVLLGSDSFLQLDIVLPYSGLVAMAAVADASVAFWHDRRQTAAHG